MADHKERALSQRRMHLRDKDIPIVDRLARSKPDNSGEYIFARKRDKRRPQCE